MKAPVLFDTQEMIDYFFDLTEEVHDIIDYQPKTYLNTYIYKEVSDLRTIYDGMSGIKNCPMIDERVTTHHLAKGILHYIYFDEHNAIGLENDHLHTYAFISNQQKKEYHDIFKEHYPKASNQLWFSYMKTETEFDWHVDGPMLRYHQVLINDGITPSFTSLEGDVYCKPGEAFIEDANLSHKVKPNTKERLHLIGSVWYA